MHPGGLPLDCETVVAEALALEMAKAADRLVLDGLPYFYAGATVIGRGTVEVSIREGIDYLSAIARSLLRQGCVGFYYEKRSDHAPTPKVETAADRRKRVDRGKAMINQLVKEVDIASTVDRLRELDLLHQREILPEYGELQREWVEHDLARNVSVIAGQEMGTKSQHLQFAAKGKYPDDHILLIGDAPGDRDVAKAVNVLYYPINPGDEDRPWQRFHDEALGKFLNGTYAGEYEAAVVAEFEKLLGKSEFTGVSPVDAFCGFMDTRI
jgi:hypothetical protein